MASCCASIIRQTVEVGWAAVFLQVTGHHRLLETNPALRRLIEMRNPYIDPINILQVGFVQQGCCLIWMLQQCDSSAGDAQLKLECSLLMVQSQHLDVVDAQCPVCLSHQTSIDLQQAGLIACAACPRDAYCAFGIFSCVAHMLPS
jgi:hypothetical protein